MRELLYTKYRLDYAYFEIINQQCRQVDAFAFSLLENKLTQPEHLRLPGDSRINQTKAYYFDTESGMLKQVAWNYSVENDARGYVESRFREVRLQDSRDCLVSPALLEVLKNLLQFTYQACSEKSSVFLRIDSNQLFEDLPDPALLPWFLQLYYIFLPSEFAGRVIFINQYADTVRNLGKFPKFPDQSLPAMRPEQAHSSLMQILHESENQLEYEAMLRFLWQEIFAYPVEFPEDSDFHQDLDLMQDFEKTVRLWEKFRRICQQPKPSGWEIMAQEKLHQWLVSRMDSLIKQLCDAGSCLTFRECLKNYQKILRILQKHKNASIYHALYQRLLLHKFQQAYLQDQEAYLRDAYRILSDHGTAYLPEDLEYYSNFCFSCVNVLENVPEIYARIVSLTDGNIREFFDALVRDALDSQAVKSWYLRIEDETIQRLQNFTGYAEYDPACEPDQKAGQLRAFLELATICAEFAGYDFRKTAFAQYAGKSRNHVRMQYFADDILYQNITLTELLKFFADWRIEDFYAGLHPAVLEAFLSSLQYSRLSQTEKKAFQPFLQQYQEFRNARLALNRQDDPDLTGLCDAFPELIRAHTSAFNACQSGEAGALLLFVSKTILGDPVTLICLLELYSRSFLTKQDQKKYESYYQFYELLLQPLLRADQLTMQDVQYLIWMFEKNQFADPRNPSRRMELLRNLGQKFTKTMPERLLTGKQQDFSDFPGMLLHRLSVREALTDPERQTLRAFLERCHADNRRLADHEIFRDHSANYAQWLRRYLTELIKNF